MRIKLSILNGSESVALNSYLLRAELGPLNADARNAMQFYSEGIEGLEGRQEKQEELKGTESKHSQVRNVPLANTSARTMHILEHDAVLERPENLDSPETQENPVPSRRSNAVAISPAQLQTQSVFQRTRQSLSPIPLPLFNVFFTLFASFAVKHFPQGLFASSAFSAFPVPLHGASIRVGASSKSMLRRFNSRPSRGFTLVELIAASVIVAMISAAAALVIFRMSRTLRGASAQEAFARADAGAALMARDVLTASRENDLTFAKLSIAHGGQTDPAQAHDSITMLSLSSRPVRALPSHNEGPVHEVQYRVDRPPVTSAREAPQSCLMKREDPNPDEYLDAGGVVTPVVPGIVGLRIQAYDGTSWFDDWDTDSDGYPHAVRITVSASSDDGRVVRIARRTISLDRTPLPVVAPTTEATQ